MPPTRRSGSADSTTRSAILDAAEQVMVEHGYAAVTSRRVAAAAGVHAGNVHYYFATIDDLFLAVLDRGAERSSGRIEAALASPRPLTALWQLQSATRGVGVLDELMAAAKHREVLAARVAELGKVTRQLQIDAFRELLPQYGLGPELTPEIFAAMMQGTALLMARQQALGVTDGRTPSEAVTALIEQLELRRQARRTGS